LLPFVWDAVGALDALSGAVAWSGTSVGRKGRQWEVDSCDEHVEGLVYALIARG
jgi:hypothetical protein